MDIQDHTIGVFSQVVIVSQDPEWADMSNPKGYIYGDRYMVRLADEAGRVLIHERAFEDEGEAVTLADRVYRTGMINPDFWHPGRAVYGSRAWVEDGEDAYEIELERQEDARLV